MVRAIVTGALVIVVALAPTGCPRDPHPERKPSPVPSCYRWNNDGIQETECGLQTGRQGD